MLIMSTISVVGGKNKAVVTGRLQTVVFTLVDKDTEIIDDYQNYYSVYSLKTEDGDGINHKVKNQKLDIELNKKTAFTFIDGEIVAYKANKNNNHSAEVLDDLSHVRSKPNIFISFIALVVLNIPFFNTLMYLFYALAPLFESDDYSLINDEVINTARDKSIVPQSLISTLISLVGSGLIVYDYPTVGVLVNLAISLPFIYNSNRIEREVIDGKNRLISKIKADLDNFKI
jgi:hypothetical protein